MSATIIRLPTADSYYRVRRSCHCYLVELVTPCPGKPPVVSVLFTTVVSDLARSVAEGEGIKMRRPVRLPRGWA
jgi:hypothetical protein